METKQQIRNFETKLMTDAYKNIEEKHRRKMIEHRTTEMAVTDLDKYWTALDKVDQHGCACCLLLVMRMRRTRSTTTPTTRTTCVRWARG